MLLRLVLRLEMIRPDTFRGSRDERQGMALDMGLKLDEAGVCVLSLEPFEVTLNYVRRITMVFIENGCTF